MRPELVVHTCILTPGQEWRQSSQSRILRFSSLLCCFSVGKHHLDHQEPLFKNEFRVVEAYNGNEWMFFVFFLITVKEVSVKCVALLFVKNNVSLQAVLFNLTTLLRWCGWGHEAWGGEVNCLLLILLSNSLWESFAFFEQSHSFFLEETMVVIAQWVCDLLWNEVLK